MNGRWSSLIGAALFVVGLTACGGAGSTSGNITPPAGSSFGSSNLQLKTQVILPNLGAGSTPAFSYDIGAVDPTLHRYYLADRTNKALDVIDTRTNALRVIPGPYAGIQSSNDISGPDGVVSIPGNPDVYVGDVDSVKVVDTNAGTVVKIIATGTAGKRTDEGCYDKDDNLVMFANPADSPPYASWINASTNAVVAVFPFNGSAGLEACVYDPGTKSFFINNDGTAANPSGELDVFPAASVVAGAPAIANAYPEGNCGPAGIDLGPNHQLVVGCDAPAGDPQITLIMNTSGAIVKTITQVGGEDEVAYDSFANRYYTASRDWTANGISQTGNANATFVPVLGVIDAATNTWIQNVPTGRGSHSVAADANTGHVFVPVPSTATANGGVNVYGLAGSP
ncbi:MAG TPA: hypothetical protein VMA36_12670 [Candidatus Limnocylindria bacterium]|jgi:hypothetical protein|nr:hypothetical protein [Candidatus Limnocylindria bacterium]